MKVMNLYIDDNKVNPGLIINKFSKKLKVNLVDKIIDNTLVIKSNCNVDWSYIAEQDFTANNNFVFFDEYLDNDLRRDKYIESGIKYVHLIEDKNFREIPIVKYTKSCDELRPVLFLDRDGILNEDTGYVYEYDNSIIFKDMIEVVKLANSLSIPVVIVTNQAGVARGMYSLDDVENFHSKLVSYYASFGAVINHIEVCPFHKEHGNQEWKFDSLLRKPNPGMHLKALASVSGTITNSLMIGDKESDRILLNGLKSFILSGNYEMDSLNESYSTRQELCEEISKYLNNLLDLS